MLGFPPKIYYYVRFTRFQCFRWCQWRAPWHPLALGQRFDHCVLLQGVDAALSAPTQNRHWHGLEWGWSVRPCPSNPDERGRFLFCCLQEKKNKHKTEITRAVLKSCSASVVQPSIICGHWGRYPSAVPLRRYPQGVQEDKRFQTSSGCRAGRGRLATANDRCSIYREHDQSDCEPPSLCGVGGLVICYSKLTIP